MHYYGTKLSENLSRREPEGYLLCLNVPVARSGTQDYLPAELGLPGKGPPVPVYRPEEEVFSPEAMASFEGMPVTDGHPPGGVDAGNIRSLQKGHAHNIRRGSGKEKDLLLADLIITDPKLADAVLKEGKREISCGYTYELCRENGRYVQRKIRGNHVAVVDVGRAGSRVSIKDEQPSEPPVQRRAAVLQPPTRGEPERRSRDGARRSHEQPKERRIIMKKSLTKVLARLAKDGDTETVAEILEEMIAPEDAGTPEEADQEAPETEVAPAAEISETVSDEEGLSGILERLDRIIALLELAAGDEQAEAPLPEHVTEAVTEAVEEVLESADPAAEQISAVMEEILEPAFSTVMEASEGDGEEPDEPLPEVLKTGDALRAALTAVRPALARMPKNQRRRVAGDIAARLRRGGNGEKGSGIYAAMASARRGRGEAGADLGRRIMEKRNPHYRQ